MRNLHAFFTKENHVVQTLQSIVRSESSVAFRSKAVLWKKSSLFWRSLYFFKSLVWKANAFLTVEKITLFKRFNALLEVKGVCHLVWNDVLWTISIFFYNCLYYFWSLMIKSQTSVTKGNHFVQALENIVRCERSVVAFLSKFCILKDNLVLP